MTTATPSTTDPAPALEIPTTTMSPAQWRAAGATLAWQGHDVFYRDSSRDSAHGAAPDANADRPALLLLHGFPTSSWDWRHIWDALARSYRVIAFDYVGFGFSAKPPGYRYNMADQADLQEAFLRQHGVSEYHVLAHDYGDTVAQELLARQAEPGSRPRLASVAFLNGGLFPEAHRPLLTQKLLLSVLGPVVAQLMSQRAFARAMGRIFGPETQPDEALLEAFWQLIEFNDGRRAFPSLIRYMVERRQHRERWVGALEKPTVPLKLIDGGADPISGSHMVDRYRELVPQPDVTLLPAIGHYPQCEAPREVLAAYLAFRDKL